MRLPALVLLGGLALVACGGDDSSDGDDASDATTAEVAGSSGDAGDASASGGGDLFVPLDYLQGAWCDHEGTTWTIDGEMAQLDDGAGGTGQMPVNALFFDAPGVLISQSDDEFVFDAAGDEVTFTRGAC